MDNTSGIQTYNLEQLTYKSKYKELELFKYGDGEIEISIEEERTNRFYLTKDQVGILIKWLNESLL